MPVFEAQPLEGEVSSTAVRRAIAEGRLSDAADMLGRPYSIHGTVGGGRQLGRTIGFPTANIEIEGPQRMLHPQEYTQPPYASTATRIHITP